MLRHTPEASEPFRISILNRNWPEDDKRFAEACALLIEIGLASFDPETEILCIPTSKFREAIAEGLLPKLRIEQTLYFTETADLDLKWKPTEQGLMSVAELDGKESLSPINHGPFKLPSLEEFLGE
jgi:hypothetical protein